MMTMRGRSGMIEKVWRIIRSQWETMSGSSSKKKNRTNRTSDKDRHVGIVLMGNIKLLKGGCEDLVRNTKTPTQTKKQKSLLLSLGQTQSAKREI